MYFQRKIYEPNCPDDILGDLLILLQLEYPREKEIAEQIFSIIASRRSFVFRNFLPFMINIDFIEEFMYIWHTHNEDYNFDFTSNNVATNTGSGPAGSRRTRGSDKGVREDFRLIIKQQISRTNENVTALIANFITQENLQLMHYLFDVDVGQFQ